MPKKLSARLHSVTPKQISALLVICIVAAIGTYLIVGSHAASPYASVDANTGTLAAGAVAQADSTASDGTKVLFNGTSTGTQTSNCFPSPSACGYPDPAATSGSSVVGPIDSNGNSVACSSLTASGSITSTSAGQSITGRNITGYVLVTSNNVTINNDCITGTGGGSACTNSTGPATHQCFPLWIESGSATVTNTTIAGADATANSIIGVANSGSSGTMDHDYIYNCTECIHDSWSAGSSYIISNGNNTAHPEDWYFTDQTISANHDVFLDPKDSTAEIFGDTDLGGGGPADNHITVTGSLLAGAGYMFYPYANSSSVGSGTIDITNNRFARCVSSTITHFVSGPGGTVCGTVDLAGADSNGYWPNGGYYGVNSNSSDCSANANQVWSNNVWDDDNGTVPCDYTPIQSGSD